MIDEADDLMAGEISTLHDNKMLEIRLGSAVDSTQTEIHLGGYPTFRKSVAPPIGLAASPNGANLFDADHKIRSCR